MSTDPWTTQGQHVQYGLTTFPYKLRFFLQCSCLRITTHLTTQFWKLGVILDSYIYFPHSEVPVLLSATPNKSHNLLPFHIHNAPVLV